MCLISGLLEVKWIYDNNDTIVRRIHNTVIKYLPMVLKESAGTEFNSKFCLILGPCFVQWSKWRVLS